MKIKEQERMRPAIIWLMYTILFIVISVSVFIWFWVQNKSFVWRTDGLLQHYNALAYFGQYLRDIARTLLREGRLEIPLWDFSIGHGSDVLMTLHYYVIGDPLNLLSIFVRPGKTDVLYSVLVIIRMYLSGNAFLYLCRRYKRLDQYAVMGALVYVFCGFSLFAAVRHPYFINPMIYLPVMLVGIEKILSKERPYLFMSMVALSAISNFYFMYIILALAVIYTAVRFFSNCREAVLKNFFLLLGKFMLYGLIGLMIAGFMLIPVLGSLMEGGRLESSVKVSLLYDLKYYLRLPTRFVTPKSAGYWNYMGYGMIVVYSLMYLFVSRKHKEVRNMFLILTGIVLLPFAGHVMHGFSYVSNRWIFGYSLLMGMIITFTMPEIIHMARKKTSKALLLTAAYVAVCWGTRLIIEEKLELFYVTALATVLIIYWLYSMNKKYTISLRRKHQITYWTMLLLIAMNVIANGIVIYSPLGTDYVTTFIDYGESQSRLAKGASAGIKADDEPFYRYEENVYKQTFTHNSGLQNGHFGTDFYFSLSNGHIYDYLSEMQSNLIKTFQYRGLDGRAMLGALSSVRYFTVREGLEQYLPYGYDVEYTRYKAADDITYITYENSYWLPLGYTYSSGISAEEYKAMTSLEKQQALLQGVYVGDADLSISSTNLVYHNNQLSYTLEAGENVELNNNTIIVRKKDASLTVKFQEARDAELYLSIEGLTYTPVNPHKTDITANFLQKARTTLDSWLWKGGDSANVTIDMGSLRKNLDLYTADYSWNFGQTDFTRYLGYHEKSPTELTLTFSAVGEYDYSAITLQTQTMDDYPAQIQALSENTLENIILSPNRITGTLTLDQTKFLCFSIPYTTGWTAYINGQKQELFQANTMYMGLELEAGTHNIELIYQTPGLKTGFILTAAGITALILLTIIRQNKKRRF